MSRFDVQQLARALEQSQADVLRDLYTDDATMKIVDRDRPAFANARHAWVPRRAHNAADLG